MPRPTTVFICSQCGEESARWYGQCPGCGTWNTLDEERLRPGLGGGSAGGASLGGGGGAGGGRTRARARAAEVKPLREVRTAEVARLATGIVELDRVLGGGVVPGSLILLGGAPGIGKSTLTNMVLGNLAGAGRRTLYCSGEESAEQIRLRAARLPSAALEVPVLAETDLDVVLATLEAQAPEVCVIDSVQTLHDGGLGGAPGSVSQVREVTSRLMTLAKARRIAIVLVGHVTKEGALAGPRVLEHLVDCVLQFEGERERPYRALRALKNRFGATNDSALFEMRQGGLVEVQDASARFVSGAARAPGSVVLAAMEGSRPLLVEVQALVYPSELVPPRRVVSGLDRNRLAVVLAVLARHGGVSVGAADVFVNVVGGVRVDEPGADLAIALAVASAVRGQALAGTATPGVARGSGGRPVGGRAPAGEPSSAAARAQLAGADERATVPLACFGELGLTGEVRWVGHPERRLAEAATLGLGRTLAPTGAGGPGAVEVASLREALTAALPGRAAPAGRRAA
ncbi:MAG TPA: DNA repair protein RadA [Solirubrobacteraceae bacterium]|jgi:DNA repair protein RadA/Sms|nr:DNA repair protein RadA [Solirubrobacteraceae bacterium]